MPLCLLRQSEILWNVDLADDRNIIRQSPERPHSTLYMHTPDREAYLLPAISVIKPHPVRFLSVAQMVEASMLLAIRDLEVSDIKYLRWIDNIFYAGLYIGSTSGHFYDKRLEDAYAAVARDEVPLDSKELVKRWRDALEHRSGTPEKYLETSPHFNVIITAKFIGASNE